MKFLEYLDPISQVLCLIGVVILFFIAGTAFGILMDELRYKKNEKEQK